METPEKTLATRIFAAFEGQPEIETMTELTKEDRKEITRLYQQNKKTMHYADAGKQAQIAWLESILAPLINRY